MMRRVCAALVFLSMPGAMPATSQSPAHRTTTSTLAVAGHDSVVAVQGFVSVPEYRGNPSSRMIEIAYLRLPALRGATGVPTVYLAGGPGQAGIDTHPEALAEWQELRQVGDVILLDQRGVGRSLPRLVYRHADAPPSTVLRSGADVRAWQSTVLDAAITHWQAQGADLRGYTTAESADDIDALRQALGVPRINLLGFSYGTHLALAVIRRHGQHMAHAVMIGTEGPDHTWKLPSTMDTHWLRLARMAAADPAVAADIPDLDALLHRVLARLDRAPVVVRVATARNDSVDVQVGGDALRFILRADIGDASDLPVFPRLLHSIDRGDLSLLQRFVAKRLPGPGINLMSTLMDAASGVSDERRARIAREMQASRFGAVVNWGEEQQVRFTGAPDLGPMFRAPVVSDVPTLFLSGTLDFNAPPFQAEEVRWGFSNSAHIVVGNAGHEQILTHPRVQEAIVRFLRGGSVHEVTASWPALRFVPVR
jgi:pimeloyl-ACP methyl ester carboxylesterase